MENFCNQFGFCSALPAEWHWGIAIVMPVLMLALVGVPVANILHRTGRSRWWTVLAFIPLVNLICLWVFAFARWPAMDRK